jgi:hypothetical protein
VAGEGAATGLSSFLNMALARSKSNSVVGTLAVTGAGAAAGEGATTPFVAAAARAALAWRVAAEARF